MLAEFRLFTADEDRPVKTKRKSAPPSQPPRLPNSGNGGYDEKEKLAYLLSQGYRIEVVDPFAEAFNEKYFVFIDLPGVGRMTITVNEWGDIQNEWKDSG